MSYSEHGESSYAGGVGFIPYGINPIRSGTKEPFCFVDSTDPRLGIAQRHKVITYAQLQLGNPDHDDPSTFEDYSEQEIANMNRPPPSVTYFESTDADSFTEAEIKQDKLNYVNTWRRKLNLAVKNEARNLLKKDTLCAQLAINFYNRTHATRFQLVQTLGSFCGIYAGVWTHCNFKAALDASPPKTFSAELHRVDQTHVVKTCVLLDDLDPSSHILGCEMCGDKLLHPADMFKAGK